MPTRLGKLIGVFLALWAFMGPAPSIAQEMSTIDNFIYQNRGSNNKLTEMFVGLRCSSVYKMMSIYLKENNINDLSKKYDEASDAALMFAYENREKSTVDYMGGQIKIMSVAYAERFLRAKALTGNGTDDDVIEADIKTCGMIFDQRVGG